MKTKEEIQKGIEALRTELINSGYSFVLAVRAPEVDSFSLSRAGETVICLGMCELLKGMVLDTVGFDNYVKE